MNDAPKALICEHADSGIRVKVTLTEHKMKTVNARGVECEWVLERVMLTCGGQPVRPWENDSSQVAVWCCDRWINFAIVEVL
jgi:hypothetical protein